ncbi:MAG: hypothetical protein ABI599_15210 [Flavobacteriales bacterium]
MVIAFVVFPACTEVFEEDLEGAGVVLLTPPPDHTTTANQIQFRWETVPHASNYRIQVASPSFVNPASFLTDSASANTSWTQTFSPGTYEWRVRGENSNSHTEYFTRAFTIESTEDLTGQVPLLVSPADNTVTSNTSVTFEWDTLPFTDDNRFQLREDDQLGTVVQDLITPDNTITLSALTEGHFAWGVQATNTVPSSSAFAFRSITIDTTAPTAPVQVTPASGATLTDGTFIFLWQGGQDALTNTSDSLLVKDAFSQLIRSIGGLDGSHADSLGTGTYTWSVKTVDAAGNASTAGPIAFTVP